MSAPRTEAGRELLDGFAPMPRPEAPELHRRSAMGRRTKLEAAILAIEAEAGALDAERLAMAIRTAEIRSQMEAERAGAVPAEPAPEPAFYRVYAVKVAREYLDGPLTFASDGTLEESRDGS